MGGLGITFWRFEVGGDVPVVWHPLLQGSVTAPVVWLPSDVDGFQAVLLRHRSANVLGEGEAALFYILELCSPSGPADGDLFWHGDHPDTGALM